MSMHPAIYQQLALDRIDSLRGSARRRQLARAVSERSRQPVRTAVQLRLSACREELERLAQLSEREVRGGEWLVADIDGVPVAAVSLEDGATLYDPFKPTSQVVSLLKLRRKQVLAAA